MPALARAVPWVSLGTWPTPVEPLPEIAKDLFVKRDDLSGVRYGGNKVRTLEVLFGVARARGAERIWATGAYGSNHALATVLHAPDAGLEPGVMLFPQPHTACAHENLLATLTARPRVRTLVSWATLPFAIAWTRLSDKKAYVMIPGGATPEGALGYVSAALELAEQVRAKVLPAPGRIVLAVGSTCTTAGLLAGSALAGRLGLWDRLPQIWAVRVTPWPVTAAMRIVLLAARTAALVARVTGDRRLSIPASELRARLRVVGGHIGRGYGYVNPRSLDLARRFAAAKGPPLDTCYSAKGACGLLEPFAGTTLFWATKSSRPLRTDDPGETPRLMRRWLERPMLG